MSLIRAQQISGSVASASYALTASYTQTSSYTTSSNVNGPYGSNSILSASYASSSTNSESTLLTKIYAQNHLNQTILKGTVVRITGSNNSSDLPRIVTASYTNDNNSANTLGITMQNIPADATGYVVTEGILTGIDTSNFISGQLVYLGATGSIIGSAPLAPLHAVRLGEVIKHQSQNGSIYVRIDNGYELGELHNVLDTTIDISYGDVLMKSGSNWITSRDLSVNDLTYNTTTSGLSYVSLGPYNPLNPAPGEYDIVTYSPKNYFGIMLDGVIHDVTNNYSGLFRCNVVNTATTVSDSLIEFLTTTNAQLTTDIYFNNLLRFNVVFIPNTSLQVTLQNYSTTNTYRIRPNYRLIKDCFY